MFGTALSPTQINYSFSYKILVRLTSELVKPIFFGPSDEKLAIIGRMTHLSRKWATIEQNTENAKKNVLIHTLLN